MTRTQLASLLAVPLLLAAAEVSAQDARLGSTKERLKTNYVASCIPSARESTKGQNVSEDVIATYCHCSAGFIDDLSDDLVLDLVGTETKREKPGKEVMIRLLAKAETCRPGGK